MASGLTPKIVITFIFLVKTVTPFYFPEQKPHLGLSEEVQAHLWINWNVRTRTLKGEILMYNGQLMSDFSGHDSNPLLQGPPAPPKWLPSQKPRTGCLKAGYLVPYKRSPASPSPGMM